MNFGLRKMKFKELNETLNRFATTKPSPTASLDWEVKL
jgi:hypothetical protein